MTEHTNPDPWRSTESATGPRADQDDATTPTTAIPNDQAAPMGANAADPTQEGGPGPWYSSGMAPDAASTVDPDAAADPAADLAYQAPKRRSWKKVAGVAAVAAVVAVGGVAAVTVANASNDGGSGHSASATGPGASVGSAGDSHPGGFGRGGAMALAGALHGEFVVQADDSGTQVMRMQRGAVTAVSADSLLVTSTDGFSATYVIDADLDVSAISVDDNVLVLATVDGDVVTATAVRSGTDLSGSSGGPGPGRHEGNPEGSGEQAPSSGATPPSAPEPGSPVPSGPVPSAAVPSQAPQTS